MSHRYLERRAAKKDQAEIEGGMNMRKRLDDIFAALMLLAAIAVTVAGYICMSHSIDQAKAERAPAQIAPVHLETAEPPSPPPIPTPVPALTYCPDIPLSADLQRVLCESCGEAGVPLALALGLIEVESCFMEDADNGQCYGLMQLNRDYFPDELSAEDNLREGILYLGRLLEQHGDTGAALTAYNAGYDTGSRAYASAVLRAAKWWEEGLG